MDIPVLAIVEHALGPALAHAISVARPTADPRKDEALLVAAPETPAAHGEGNQTDDDGDGDGGWVRAFPTRPAGLLLVRHGDRDVGADHGYDRSVDLDRLIV